MHVVLFCSLRELFKIGKCTSPETTSPEVDEYVQSGRDNGDIFEEHYSTSNLNTF